MAAVERLLSNISKDSTIPVLKEKLSYFDDNNGGLSTIIELILLTSVEFIFSYSISIIQKRSESMLTNLFPNFESSLISLIIKFAKMNEESSCIKLFE